MADVSEVLQKLQKTAEKAAAKAVSDAKFCASEFRENPKYDGVRSTLITVKDFIGYIPNYIDGVIGSFRSK